MFKFEEFNVTVLSEPPWNVHNDNIDIEVSLADGRRFAATFFTVENLSDLLKKFRASGEFGCGTFVWAAKMIVLRDLTQCSIYTTIHELLSTCEIEEAMLEIHDDLQA